MLTTSAPRARLLPLLRELDELKRVRPAPSGRSLAERSFLRAWAAIAAGVDVDDVARNELGAALVAVRLAGADVSLLVAGGLDRDQAGVVCEAARCAALAGTGPWAPALDDVASSGASLEDRGPPPRFATLLAVQPRAPATSAHRPRQSVEVPENHAEHCAAVALIGTVMAVAEGADAGTVFLAGLSHHLHNAQLPDGGFAGELTPGSHLDTIVATFRRLALAELGPHVAEAVDMAIAQTVDATTPEGRAFHAADVIDRVLQAHHHAGAAAFTLEQALSEHGLVHEGPLQRYHHLVLDEVGL